MVIKKCGFFIVSITLLLSLFACAKTSPENETQTSVSTSIEVANFKLSDLIESRKVISEALSYAKTAADENQNRLADQADILMVTIQPDSKLKDVVANKTEQERVTLEILKGIFSVGAQYFYKIPSPVAGAIANSAEELGNKIAGWQVLGQLSYAKITSKTGVLEVVYHKSFGEVWASFDISNPAGRVVMYVPVEPILGSQEGAGNILLSKGAKPILDKCRVAYRFGNVTAILTPATALTQQPVTPDKMTAVTPVPKTTATASPNTVQGLSNEIALINGISIALSKVERKEKTTYLYLSFRKVNSEAQESPLKLQIVDDRDNTYSKIVYDVHGEHLTTKMFTGWNIKALPEGFTWITRYNIEIPQEAPIKKVLIGDQEKQIELSKYELTTPNLDSQLKQGLISLGEKLSQGKNISWSIQSIQKEARNNSVNPGSPIIVDRWAVTVEAENLDYNPRDITLGMKLQLTDGSVTYTNQNTSGFNYDYMGGYDDGDGYWETGGHIGYISKTIPAQSKITVKYCFPEREIVFRPVGSPQSQPTYLLDLQPRAILILNFPEDGREAYAGVFFSTHQDAEAYILKY